MSRRVSDSADKCSRASAKVFLPPFFRSRAISRPRVSWSPREPLMKIGTISLSAILLLTAPVLGAEQNSSPARIAVVSTQRVSVESNDGKAAQARIQALQQEKA